jgi:hypothetical protein
MRFAFVPLLFFSLRILDPTVQSLLLTGYTHSPTLRAMVDSLERSDVIVHVVTAPRRSGIAGTTTFVTAAGGKRYLRVALAPYMTDGDTVAILAHELRHATEIAAEPRVISAQTMVAFYVRVGRRCGTCSDQAFDTDAAVAAGERVSAEMRASRAARLTAGAGE